MPDMMIEPGRLPLGGAASGIAPMPLDTVLPRGDLPQAEGTQGTEEEAGKEGAAGKAPMMDQVSEELQKAMEQWTMGSLKKMVAEMQARLTDTLLSYQPDPKKSDEENLREIREAVQRYSEALASKGASLQMTRPLEEALLEALAKWLESIMAQLLHQLGPAGATDKVAQLLERLFRQIAGTPPSRGKASAQAAALLQRSTGQQRSAGHTAAPQPQRPQCSEEGVRYRRGEGGARLDSSYSGQAQRLQAQEMRPVDTGRSLPPKAGAGVQTLRTAAAFQAASARNPEAEIVKELQFAEAFAKNLPKQTMLPNAKELPFVSEERLGVEIGLLWLKAETAAQEPGISASTAGMIRQAAEQRTAGFLYEAGYALQMAARAYPPGLCPDLWREDMLRVREELIRRYRQTKDPQKSLLETIAYAIEVFRDKQSSGKYRTWLRYLPERGFFLDQVGIEDIRQGWQGLCQSWERFLRDMGLRDAFSFREAAGLQSLWAMVLPPQKKTEVQKASSISLIGWFSAASVTSAIYSVCFAASTVIRVGTATSALCFAFAAFTLFRRGRRK